MKTRNHRRRAAGFTLIEAALTTVIVGTGVLAIVEAQQAYHRKNGWAQRTSTAMLLANEIRELTLNMPLSDPFTGVTHLGPEDNEADVSAYDDLDDFAGVVDPVTGIGAGTTFSPPINALRQQVPDMDRWSQFVQVGNVLPGNISAEATQPLGTTPLMRVTVTVRYLQPGDENPSDVTTLTWVVADN